MISKIPGHDIWVEAYRPQKIDDMILPAELKSVAQGYVKSGSMKNVIFSGTAGIGKTTLARCIAKELDADFMVLNASLENSIDDVRNKMARFASTVSFEDKKKITLLDEGDGLSGPAQNGLKAFIEEFSGNHTLIITCNHKAKIIEPIHSRCAVFDFKISKAERVSLATQFFKRTLKILSNESVEYDKTVVAEVVNKFFPDFRRTLNELQRYAATGKIDSGILVNFTDDSIKELFTAIKNKKFNLMRQWIANSDMDATQFFRLVYDNADKQMEPKSIPGLILLLGQYQYQASLVADHEINIAAFCTELITGDISWK